MCSNGSLGATTPSSRETPPKKEVTQRMPKPLRPGTPAPKSGIYTKKPGGGQVVSTQGNPLPPGPKGTTYTDTQNAKHKGGK